MSPLPVRLPGAVSGTDPRFRWGALAAGLAVTFIVSLAAAGLVALAIYATPITEQSASAFLFALGVASLVLGAGYAGHLARTLGWVHGLAVGLGYVLVSLVLQPMLFSGGWSLGGTLQRLLLGVAAGTLGGVFGVNL